MPTNPRNVSRCSSCNAEIIWCRTAAGKMMPLDKVPSALGTFAIDEGEAIHKKDVPAHFGRAEVELHLSHFAACQFAAQHRKPRST